MTPNFVLLDATLPDVARLLIAMVQTRDAVEHRSWSHPQEPTTEEWWADVLADPRAFYRLADEPRDTILVACSKCDWKAAFRRDELIAAHGAAYPMPSLLGRRGRDLVRQYLADHVFVYHCNQNPPYKCSDG